MFNQRASRSLLILQEILQNYPFLMVQNCEMQGCQSYGVKQI